MHHRLFIGLALALLCIDLLFAAAAAARPQAYGSQQLVRLPGGRPGLMVVINGRGPFPFLIDTATSHTVLIPALREQLAIPPAAGPTYDVVTAAGAVRSRFHRIDEIAASGVIVEGVHAVIIDLPRQVGVSGILGADFLSNFTVDLDLGKQTMTLYPDKTVLHPAGFAPIQARVNPYAFIVVPARVDNVFASAVFDTGALYTVVNPKLAMQTDRAVKTILRNIESKIIDAAQQRAWAESFNLARVSVGPVTWRDRRVIVANMRVFDHTGLNREPAIFIGLDFMAGRRIILDYGNGSLWLSR